MTRALHVAAMEKALNAALGLDPELLDSLGSFAGRCLEIRVSPFPEPVVLCFGEPGTGVSLETGAAGGIASVVIAGSAASLVRLLLNPGDETLLRRGDVTITGDVVLAATLRETLARADLDWEEVLARVFGDVAGHQLGRGIRVAAGFARAAARKFGEDVSEFLLHEEQLTPRSEEAGMFARDVDEMRDDVERLAARIARIQERIR